jgi:hypothetical protein
MSELIKKLAPTGIVAAVAAWCCWPHLPGRETDLGLQAPDTLPKIAASLLSPEFESASGRNPFRPVAEHEDEYAAGAEPVVSTVTRQQETSGSPKEKPGSPREKPGSPKEEPSPEQDPLEIVKSLPLQATFVHGDRRMALIDGQFCEEGSTLAVADSARSPCIVARISAHRVLVLYRGRTVELGYQD